MKEPNWKTRSSRVLPTSAQRAANKINKKELKKRLLNDNKPISSQRSIQAGLPRRPKKPFSIRRRLRARGAFNTNSRSRLNLKYFSRPSQSCVDNNLEELESFAAYIASGRVDTQKPQKYQFEVKEGQMRHLNSCRSLEKIRIHKKYASLAKLNNKSPQPKAMNSMRRRILKSKPTTPGKLEELLDDLIRRDKSRGRVDEEAENGDSDTDFIDQFGRKSTRQFKLKERIFEIKEEASQERAKSQLKSNQENRKKRSGRGRVTRPKKKFKLNYLSFNPATKQGGLSQRNSARKIQLKSKMSSKKLRHRRTKTDANYCTTHARKSLAKEKPAQGSRADIAKPRAEEAKERAKKKEGKRKSARKKKTEKRHSYVTHFAGKRHKGRINFLKPFDESDIEFYKRRIWSCKRIRKYLKKIHAQVDDFAAERRRSAEKKGQRRKRSKSKGRGDEARSGGAIEDVEAVLRLNPKKLKRILKKSVAENLGESKDCSFRNMSFGRNNSKISINITVNSVKRSSIQNNIIIKKESQARMRTPPKAKTARVDRPDKAEKKMAERGGPGKARGNEVGKKTKRKSVLKLPKRANGECATTSKPKRRHRSKASGKQLFSSAKKSERGEKNEATGASVEEEAERNDNQLRSRYRRQKTKSMYHGELRRMFRVKPSSEKRVVKRNKSMLRNAGPKSGREEEQRGESKAKPRKKSRKPKRSVRIKKPRASAKAESKEQRHSQDTRKKQRKRKKIRCSRKASKAKSKRLEATSQKEAKMSKSEDDEQAESGQKSHRSAQQKSEAREASREQDKPQLKPKREQNVDSARPRNKDDPKKRSGSKRKAEQRTGASEQVGMALHEKYSDLRRALQIKIVKASLLGKPVTTNRGFYDILKTIGAGSYAKVSLGVSVLTGHKVALKIYDKTKITSSLTVDRIYSEMKILRRMNHPNIVNFIEIFENNKNIFTVMEYVNGSDLLKYLIKNGHFSERRFTGILRDIIEGLEYIHSHRILHRDVKLDNILFSKSGKVKICDFGISRRMKAGKAIFEHIGTPAYLAPEIIIGNGYSGFSADVWSLGVMTYMAVTGKVPFKGNNMSELHSSILNDKVIFPSKPVLSGKIKNAILGMLDKDPVKRLTLKEVSGLLRFPAVISPKLHINFMDEALIEQIKMFGFCEKSVKKALRNDDINHITALYKMLRFNQD